SYAGQRIALVCMSDQVFNRRYTFLEKFYEMPAFGDAYIYGVLYCSSSGTAHSAQYALAAMMEKAVKGELPFIDHCREYAKKAERAKKSFTDNGFHIVYEYDGDQPISDGFFFTIGYKDLSAKDLQLELLRYGVASISLASTGSEQPGVRICVSMLRSEEDFEKLEKFLQKFNADHNKA
ncbi:MAG: pyridoxal phosphate-dependent aminotransferase, partial [Muribaculaceae bacterium]|nr:pyridoxal phosphate-dependent aminotransferase [Muribaculaceae bacterium]